MAIAPLVIEGSQIASAVADKVGTGSDFKGDNGVISTIAVNDTIEIVNHDPH